MACPPTCKSPTPAQAHCSVCHRTFGGVTGFDAHRRNGACVDPAEMGYVERDGVWRTPMTDAARHRFAPRGGVMGAATCASGANARTSGRRDVES